MVSNTEKQNGGDGNGFIWLRKSSDAKSVGQLGNRSLLLLDTDKCHCAVRQLLCAVTGYQSGAVRSDDVWMPKCLHLHGRAVTQHTAPPSLAYGHTVTQYSAADNRLTAVVTFRKLQCKQRKLTEGKH